MTIEQTQETYTKLDLNAAGHQKFKIVKAVTETIEQQITVEEINAQITRLTAEIQRLEKQKGDLEKL